ncbi:ribonuclease III, partial [Mycena galericulata]
PPLPKIGSEDIRTQIFNYATFVHPVHEFEDPSDDPSLDNEQLILLGGSTLGLVVTSLISEMYPGLRVDPSTKIREMLLDKSMLARIAVKYTLPKQLKGDVAKVDASTDKVHGSYIGGLYTELGFEPVETWLNALFRPYAIAAYNILSAQYSSTNAKQESPSVPGSDCPSPPFPGDRDGTVNTLALLHEHLQKRRQRAEWIFSDSSSFGQNASKSGSTEISRPRGGGPQSPMWSAEVVVNGEILGRGEGSTKKAARNEGAKQALIRMGVSLWYVHTLNIFASTYISTPFRLCISIMCI